MPDPIDLNGSPLSFAASIDDDAFEKSAENIIQTNRRIYESEMKRFNEGIANQKEYNRIISENPGMFKNLDRDTVLQLASFDKLKTELRAVSQAKDELNKSYAAGNTSQEAYRASIGQLVGQEQDLVMALANVSAELAKSESLQKASASAMATITAQIEKQEQAYKSLSIAEQQGNTGKSMQEGITTLRQQLTGLKQDFSNLTSNAFADLTPQLAQLNKAEQSYAHISRLQKELADVQVQKTDLDQNFAKSKESAQNYRVELDKLNQAESNLKNQIEVTKASQKSLDAQFAASQNKIAAETKQLEKLRAIYAELAKTDVSTPAAKGTKADITRLESSIAKGQDQETKILEQRAQAADKLEEQYKALNAIKLEKQEFKTNFGDATKYITQYQAAITQLNNQEHELTASIQQETAALQRSQAVYASVSAAIAQHSNKVKELQADYDKLSVADQINPEIGGKMLANIDTLQKQLTILRNNVDSFPDITLGGFTEGITQVAKLETEIDGLISKINGIPDQKVKIDSTGELEDLIRKIAEAKKQLAALPESEKLDINIGGAFQQDLTELETSISRVIEKILGMPEFSLGNLDQERQKLAALENQLENLTDEEMKSGFGDKLIADIDQAEAKVKLLAAAVNAVPELTLGNVQDKINDLLKLKQVQDSLSGADVGTVKLDGIEQAVKNLEAFKTSLSKGITVPGIEKALRSLNKVQNEFEELANIRAAKLDLTNNFDAATGDVQEYEAAIASLAARENELANSINEGAAALLRSDAVQKNAAENIEDTIARLESLKLSYAQLSDADKGSEKGLALAATIEKLKVEVDGLNTALQTTGKGVTDETTAKIAGVVKLKDEYRNLLKVQKEISQVRAAKLELKTDFDAARIDAETYGKSLEQLEDQETGLIVAYQKQSAELRANNEFQKSGNAIIEETTKEINKLKAAYQSLPAAAKVDVNVGGEMKTAIAGLEQDLQNYKNILNNADASGGFDKSVAGAQQFKKSIQSLQIEMQSYDAIVRKSTDPAIIKKYTTEIARLQKEIRQVGNAGKTGFDAMGNPIKEQLSLIGRLEKAAALYKKAIEQATNPELINKYNRKLEETNAELSRMQNRGKTGFDSVGNAIDKTGGKLGGFKSMLTNIAGAFGLVGLADTLVNFGRELGEVAVKASGIDRAFSRIGDTAYLEKLRKETKGFVSDFELERLTVKAQNLNIPLKDMGTYLLFASERAKETGESVDKMTNDIVEGLGKESLRIIDNLGISQKAVREEMKAGGTMAEAVGRIMRREMGEAGVEVDTLADKTNKMSVTWDNARKSVAGFFTRMLNPQGANDQVIGALTQRVLKQFGDFEKATAEQRKQAIEEQAKSVAELSKAYEQAQKTAVTTDSSLDGGRADRMAKQAGEELQAAKNVLQTIKQQNRELEKKERINMGNLTIAEAEERLSKAQESLQNTEFSDEREKYQKQVDEYTAQLEVLRRNGNAEFAKLLSDVDANFKELVKLSTNEADLKQLQEGLQNKINSLAPDSKDIARLQKKLLEVNKLLDNYQIKDDKKGAKLDNKSYEQRIALLQKLAEMETKYNAKNLTPDQLANEQLQDEFKKLANEIGKFNRDPKNTVKIPLARLEDLRLKATADLMYKQDTEKLKIELERQKGIFQEYENFKSATNKEAADQRFAYDKKAFDNYGAYLESELAKIDTSQNLDAPTQTRLDMLKQQSQEYWKSERDERTKSLQEALVATAGYEQQRIKIVERYAKMAKELRNANPGKNVDPEIAEINRLMQADIDSAKDAAYQKTEIYKKLSEDVVRYTRKEIEAQIESANMLLENTNLTPELREKIQSELKNLQFTLKIGVDKSYVAELKKHKALIENNLKNNNLSEAAFRDQRLELEKINKLLAAAKYEKIADSLGKTSAYLGEAANLIGKFNEKAGETLSTMSQIAGAASGLFEGLASGNPLAIVQGAIGAVSGLIDLFDRSDEKAAARERREEQARERTRLALVEMNRLLDANAAAAEKALGTDKAAAFRNQLKLITADIAGVIKKLNAMDLTFRMVDDKGQDWGATKFKIDLTSLEDVLEQTSGVRSLEADLNAINEVLEANKDNLNELYEAIASGNLRGDTEGLQELIKTYEQLQGQLEEYKAKIQQLFTGTTFESIADTIADGFRQGFDSAADQAKFFADTFEDLMKNAIIQSLKMQALEKPLKAFYDQFAAMSETGGGLTEDEVVALERMYNEILENAQKKFDDLQKLAGIDFASSTDSENTNANSLQGGIERMSQETAEIIAGQLGGMRLGILDISETTRQILAAILAPGSVNLPDAGNNTFTVPGMLEVAENGRLQVGLSQQLVMTGQQQVSIMLDALDYARMTAENTGRTADNTRAIADIDKTLRDMNRKMDANSNAIRANGG